MDSLGFDLLDRHVVDGRGGNVACTDATGSLTYARLLERSAALAGGLRVLGVGSGDGVAIEVPPGNLQVVIVCACIRLGAVPGSHGEIRIVDVDGTVRVRMDDHDLDLSVISKAGAADPAPSLTVDAASFRGAAQATFGQIIDTLLAGGSIG